eukprot:TRINITY_DN6804_c0_g1_i1.p1 TRINITY_DN6804_c0_g1~~TRINITY_DN6804_c0_g1_i1.p1  ORF type:complete len:880 (-),score=204.36 TRINITY_DN6804_c0_g1_i1:17-2656(-)
MEEQPLLYTKANTKFYALLGIGLVIISIALFVIVGIQVDINNKLPRSKNCNVEMFYRPYAGDKADLTLNTNSSKIALIGGILWINDDKNTICDQCDIVISQGKILAYGTRGSINLDDAEIIDVKGAIITPGLIDIHSHVGAYTIPTDSVGTALGYDLNDLYSTTNMYMRVLDALDYEDPSFNTVRKAGITTSLVLPGSSNMIGGQAVLIKLRKDGLPQDLVYSNTSRFLKFATGQNPIRNGQRLNRPPQSRMGAAWTLRDVFIAAAKYKLSLDQWKCDKIGTKPFNGELDPILDLLEGNAKLMVHSYRSFDMLTIIRLSKEFNFTINTFHHGCEAWKIADVLAEEGIAIAQWTDLLWSSKLEGYDSSVYQAKILSDRGIDVMFHTDHPILNGAFLLHEAQKSYAYGMDYTKAFNSITRVPAKKLGVDDRVGQLTVGYNADVVVWDRHPFRIGARPQKIYIDGFLQENTTLLASSGNFSSPQKVAGVPLTTSGPTACQRISSNTIFISGVLLYPMNSSDVSYSIPNTNIVIQNGIVTCISPACTAPIGADVYQINGIAIPGIVSTGSQLGQYEVNAEPDSHDGTADVSDNFNVRAGDGIRLNSFYGRMLKSAWAGGVTTAIVKPEGTYLINGMSVCFNTQSENGVNGAIVKQDVSFDITLGNKAKKGGVFNSFSGQISQLRTYFSSATPNVRIQQVLNGSIPLVVSVQQSDQIESLIRFKGEFNIPHVVVLGGAESPLVATQLAAANITVILSPIRPTGEINFEEWNGFTNSSAPSYLVSKGVKVVISMKDTGNVRNLRWEAGLAYQEGLSYFDALASITRYPAEVYGLLDSGVGNLQVGLPASLVIFDGDPLSLDSNIRLVLNKGYVACDPKQYPYFDQ